MTHRTNMTYLAHIPYERWVCTDGTSVSIQTGASLYCSPRNDIGPYDTVEAGFPSVDPPASWVPYAEDPTNLTDTVYGYLPWDCVDEFITAHGGLVSLGPQPPRSRGVPPPAMTRTEGTVN